MPGPTENKLNSGFKLGEWTIYPTQNLIKGANSEERTEPKVMEVLVYLALHCGEVVKREQLIQDVWATYVTDEVLSRAISLLRGHLQDNAKQPSFIQTIPKIGYRLLQQPSPIEASRSAKRKKPTRLIVTAVTVVLFLLVLLTFQFKKASENNAELKSLAEWFELLEAKDQAAGELKSIAVLPFDNLSGNKSNAFISEGLTDEVIMSLSKVIGLKVVARRSTSGFKNRPEDIPTIGKLLNVDAILEGSIFQQQDNLKINIQLSSTDDGFVIWSETYQQQLADAFSLQHKISYDIARALNTAPTNIDTGEYVPDTKAYQKYLQGRFLWKLRGEKALRESIGLFKQAIDLDPQFARAHLALASSMVLLPFYSTEQREPMFNQALSLIEDIPFSSDWEKGEEETIKAFIAMHRWQWIEAETRYRRAIELSPDNPNTYVWYSQHLSVVGRNQDAVTAARRALELDTVSPVVNDRMGIAYLWVDDDIRAAEHFAIGAQLGFSNQINPGYIIFLLRQQRFNEFKTVIEALHPDPNTKPDWLIENAHWVFLPENRAQALDMALKADHENRFITPLLQFGLWILIGGIDQAYSSFAKISHGHSQYLYFEFMFAREAAEFRADSRFDKLTKETGLKQYWALFGKPDYQR